MKPLHIPTPLIESKLLSKISGKKILLKMECFQPTGSFKIRGIGQLCQELIKSGHHQLVSSSGGNAGYAVAYAGKKLGVQVTVFVPKTTNPIFLKRLESEGAEIKIHGEVWDEAHQAAMDFVNKTNSGYVPPFDHPSIWIGHSTMIDEVAQQCEKPDAVITAVGGGGLLCGVLEGLERHRWSDILAFSVETEGAASFATSIKAGKIITLDRINTVATSLGAKRIANKLFEWSQKRSITPLVVTDDAAVLACRKFADDHRVLVEPACGAVLSIIYDMNHLKSLAETKSILVIVCGGVGISTDLLNQLMTQGI
ncbi:MAG: pyridoxal-phosphate dependent enzyme [Gammaproteobacteria bacterium]|nr:pyridoxal-phosphate dependent enzyme [Gammaproteobacteria bacterium]MCW5583772.1 pyridoxal-phosphate dependent enzyme [Gammaproteobacteria bacterium]